MGQRSRVCEQKRRRGGGTVLCTVPSLLPLAGQPGEGAGPRLAAMTVPVVAEAVVVARPLGLGRGPGVGWGA